MQTDHKQINVTVLELFKANQSRMLLLHGSRDVPDFGPALASPKSSQVRLQPDLWSDSAGFLAHLVLAEIVS